ncbi:MAG: uroporphyrinogen decarboxylase family protein [Treponema sp.]|nr:uroporphyrinogen decarboxylase family protein [Treponema sp.]
MTELNTELKKSIILANAGLENVGEVPFVVEVGPVHLATAGYFNDPEAELAWNRKFHDERQNYNDYAWPNIKPNTGINIIAEAFGCECRVNNEADPWVKNCISEENAGIVYDLEIPNVETNPAFRRVWDRIEWLQTHSELPLRAANVPSPLVSASLIWDYTNFIEALLIHPEEVHTLMEKVTRATISYIKEQFRRIKNLYSVGHELWGLPKELGVRISDDTAALLSPKLYREFGVKYNAMIAEEFGGIVVHSCGDPRNAVAGMLEIPRLKGLDFTIPQVEDWTALHDVIAGKTALFLRHCYWDHLDGNVDMAEYTKAILDVFGRKGLFIQTSMPTTEEAMALCGNLHNILSK